MLSAEEMDAAVYELRDDMIARVETKDKDAGPDEGIRSWWAERGVDYDGLGLVAMKAAYAGMIASGGQIDPIKAQMVAFQIGAAIALAALRKSGEEMQAGLDELPVTEDES